MRMKNLFAFGKLTESANSCPFDGIPIHLDLWDFLCSVLLFADSFKRWASATLNGSNGCPDCAFPEYLYIYN